MVQELLVCVRREKDITSASVVFALIGYFAGFFFVTLYIASGTDLQPNLVFKCNTKEKLF